MKHLLSVLILCFLVASLRADLAPDSLKTFTLPTIRVIVDKPSEAIGSLTQIPIEQGSGSLTLKDALQNSVGISVSMGSKDESNLRLRGFRKNEIKLMIDGRPINSGYFGNVDISKLSTLDIKEIQVVKGPSSPLYGTGSMGGVLNLITREPSSKHWFTLGSSIKRNNTQELQLSSSHSFSTWNYRAGVAGLRSDGFVLSQDFQPTHSENGGVRNHSKKEQYNLSASVNTELFTFHKIGFDISYAGMKHKDIPSSIYESRYRQYQDWARYNAGITGEFQLSENSILSSLMSYDGGGDTYLEYNDAALQYLNMDSRMDNQSWAWAPRLRTTAKGKLDLGYRYELQRNKRKDTGSYKDGKINLVQSHNLFSQYEWQLNSSLRLTSGFGISSSFIEIQDKNHLNIEPSLGLVFAPNTGSVSSIAIGRNTAPPTMRQLFSYSKGNPNLLPQSSLKLELNHLQPMFLDKVTLSGSLFYNDCRDLIDLQAGTYHNYYRLISQGLELGLIVAPLNFYEAEADYSYLEYQKESDYRLTETPKHAIEITHRIKLPAHSLLKISSSFRDSRLSQDDIGIYHTLGGYWRHDIQFILPYRTFTFNAAAENILDANYQGEYGFPEAGRDFCIGVEVRL
ncbi:MAG: TonB-dependent receptor plug domain-containing protein [Candidatus Cloacimonetes bacterium]|nr:TonB-dependent receptor plug domain-containing protein [Candidatus Cloacimonadota bacterium]